MGLAGGSFLELSRRGVRQQKLRARIQNRSDSSEALDLVHIRLMNARFRADPLSCGRPQGKSRIKIFELVPGQTLQMYPQYFLGSGLTTVHAWVAAVHASASKWHAFGTPSLFFGRDTGTFSSARRPPLADRSNRCTFRVESHTFIAHPELSTLPLAISEREPAQQNMACVSEGQNRRACIEGVFGWW